MTKPTSPILEVEGLQKTYEIKRGWKSNALHALRGVSFSLENNQTLGIVGESGCGKSTLAKVLMNIEPATGGSVRLFGKPAAEMDPKEYRETLQMIFQDPYGSINPRKTTADIIAEPLRINTKLSRKDCYDRVREVMEQVGLRPEYMIRYPHMFSGGQRQRIGIARALVLNPKILICDEPVSALDVSVQAQVLNLLLDLQQKLELSYLFISHDLTVVRHLADKIMVMYLGQVMEFGEAEDVFSHPKHPYTRALLESTPKVIARKEGCSDQQPSGSLANVQALAEGEIPSPMNPPSGCVFHTRCPKVEAQCRNDVPDFRKLNDGRRASCHFAGE